MAQPMPRPPSPFLMHEANFWEDEHRTDSLGTQFRVCKLCWLSIVAFWQRLGRMPQIFVGKGGREQRFELADRDSLRVSNGRFC